MIQKLYLDLLVAHLLLMLLIPVYGVHHKNVNTIERYSNPSVLHHSQLLLDVPNFRLLVAARDYLVSLSLENFDQSPKTQYYLPADAKKVRSCTMKGMETSQCHNFHTVLLALPSASRMDRSRALLVCGTNAFAPQCEVRKMEQLDTVLVEKSGLVSGFNPTWNTTALVTSSGQYFYGGQLDLRGIDSSIIKQKVSLAASNASALSSPYGTLVKDRRIIRSAQHDSKWINVDASFVSSFEFQQHVYFLFRETAVEYMNCGKRVYSRIGRVCQNDQGMRDHWTSFLKARLNCSMPGLYPFYFDEIQSVHVADRNGVPTLYAVFNTPDNSIHGSAVCAFTMDSVQRSFNGPFKYQASSSHAWESVNDSKDIFECRADESNSSTTTENYESRRRMNSIYQLMDQAVQPVQGRPLTISTHHSFKHIVVDVIETKFHRNVEIFFIATTDGRLLRYVRWPSLNETCFLDQLELVQPDDDILTMKLLRDTHSIYVGTVRQVIRVPMQRCHEHGSTREACLAAQDPYCGWSAHKMKCIKAPGNNYHLDAFEQAAQAKCAQSQWGEWFACAQQGGDEDCKCRRRACSGEQNETAGKCLDGWQIEVGNCTRHGGWSEWSAWGACNPSCVSGQQNRTRTCTNPKPSDGGKPCEGSSFEIRQCERLPYCNWTPWSEWSACPSNCSGVGYSQRNRTCIDFTGHAVNEDYCYGMPLETTTCSCEVQWSDWYVSELGSNEIIETRHQLPSSPSTNAFAQSEQRVRPLKYCDRCEGNLYNFKETEYLIKKCSCNTNLEWSDWSEWSECINETQRRMRSCMLESQKACEGHHVEIRFCLDDEDTQLIYQVDVLRAGMATQSRKADNIAVLPLVLVAMVSAMITFAVTWTVSLFIHKRAGQVDDHSVDAQSNGLLLDRTHRTEPNTYEVPDKYRITDPLNTLPSQVVIGGTLTRQSTLKRDFKNTSFRAKLDDSNYT